MTTKRDVDKSPFLIVKNQQNNDVKLVVSPSNFQVGLTNSPSSLTVTGHATFQQGVTSNNPVYFYQGLSGSLTKLTDGTSYLVAGNNVTITSASNGQVIISSTASGGSGDVVGPASATDNAIVRFDSTTGKLIQDSAVTIADTTGNITTPGDIAVNGGDITTTAATFNIANTNATTLNVGGAASSINMGLSTALATIGNAEIGAWPGGTAYAVFQHKDVPDTDSYALIQTFNGSTYLNSVSGRSIVLRNYNNTIGTLDNNTISLTGQTGVATTTTLGNTTGASSTTINAGEGGIDIDHIGNATINIGTNNETRTTNISTGAAYQTVTIGSNYGGSTLALRGGSDSSGGQIDVETGTGGGGNGGDINIGATSYARRVNLGTGGNSTAQDVTIGSTYLGSDIKIYAGQAGVINIGSNSVTGRTINIATGQTDGNTNIGTSTGTGMLNLHTGTGDINIGTSDYTRTVKIGSDTSCITRQTVNVAPLNTGNYNIVKICDGASNTGHEVRIISENSSQSGGYALVKIGTIANTCQTTIGNNSSNSFTKIYGGANGVTIDVQAGSSINVGGTDAVAQSVTIGNTTGASTTTIQSGTGDISLDSPDAIRFKYGGTTVGVLNEGALGTYNISFTGPSGTWTTTTIGNKSNINSSTTIQGGSSVELTGVAGTTYDIGDTNTTGNITIGKSTATNSINIGNANSTGTQTINIGSGTPTGSGKAVITIGNKIGASSTTIQAGSGDIELDSAGSIRFQQSNITAGLISTTFGICSIDFSGPVNTVTDTTIGSTYSSSSTDIDAGTGGITMTGEVMKPSQPCFLAYLDGGTQLIDTTASTITVKFNTERFDIGSDFDNTSPNYRFTAPRTGKYLFNVLLRLEDLDTAASYYYVSLITSNATYQLGIIDPNFSADLNYYWIGGDVVADMDSGDTAYVVIRQSGGAANLTYIADETTAAQICSFFSGYFMG